MPDMPPGIGIDIAEQPAPEDAWPRNPVAKAFIWFAMAWIILMVTAVVVRLTRLPVPVMIGVGTGVFLVMFGVMIYFIVRSVRCRRRRRAAGGRPGDARARLRLVGPADRCREIAAAVHDCAFEPVVFRSLHAATFAVMKDGRPVTHARRRRTRHVRTRMGRRGVGWVSLGLSIVASAMSVLLIQFVAFGSVFPITAFHAFTVIAGITLFDAMLMPVYIRIAPGVLDVMRYSILGMGRGVSERYDLRTARVCVDLDEGYARIDDMSRSERPVLFLYLRSLAGGRKSAGADILRAAVSTSATPPMPTDELSD